MSATWAEENTKLFIIVVADVATKTGSTENGFKKQEWTRILTQFYYLEERSIAKQIAGFESKV